MAQAIFGLVGVLIGAGITGGVQVFLEHRAEAKERRRASRAAGDELAWCRETLAECVKEANVGNWVALVPDLDELHPHVVALGSLMKYEDWRALREAERSLWLCSRFIDETAPNKTLTEDEVGLFRETRERCERAHDRLRELM